MSKIFLPALLSAIVPISALNHIAERDTAAVKNAERKQLSATFDSAHTMELLPHPSNDSLASPHQAVQVILHHTETTGQTITYHFTSNAKAPLKISNPASLFKMESEASAFYTSPRSLQRIYESSCRMIADYKPTPPLFGTDGQAIRAIRETDVAMSRALTMCPRRYQDMRINKP